MSTEQNNHDNDNNSNNCPICLEPMSPSDILHPIHNPPPKKTSNTFNDCQYNFCSNCIQLLIASSKQDYEEASDGHRAVKVKLVCPNCRLDLSSTIYATLELRKKEDAKQFVNVPDSELSAKELRLKYMYEQESVVRNVETGELKLSNSHSHDDDDDDDDNPTTTTITTTPQKDQQQTPKKEEEEVIVDTTLFAGLEYAMTHEEQLYVYTLLTYGNPEKLNQAAQLLSNIAEMSLKGITPSMRAGSSSSSNKPAQQAPHVRTSDQRKSSTLRTGRSGTAGAGRAYCNTNNHNNRFNSQQQQQEMQKQAKLERLKKENPLPIRMPKYIYLPIQIFYNPYDAKRTALTFVNDKPWEGVTVLDAYTRVTVRKNNNKKDGKEDVVVRTLPNVPRGGIVPAYMEEKYHFVNGEKLLVLEERSRVLISNIRGIAGRSGFQVGDVVTHVNGEVFVGDAEDLRRLLYTIWEEGNGGSGDSAAAGSSSSSGGGGVDGREGFFSLTVNADDCSAEAIQMRADRMKTGMKG